MALRALGALLRGRLVTVEVEGRSMFPTLLEGDVLLCERVRSTADLRHRSIVFIERPLSDGSYSRQVKRLVALAGETPDGAASAVPADMCWVVGDNVAVSGDSRRFGPVPYRQVHAVAFARLRRGRLSSVESDA